MKKAFILSLALLLLWIPAAQAVVGMDAFVVDTDTTDGGDNYIPIPAAYEVYGTIKNLGENGFMNHPEDIFVAPDDTLYVADGENNRVLQMTREGRVLNIITTNPGAYTCTPTAACGSPTPATCASPR